MRRMLPLREGPCTVPLSILEWVQNPRLDMFWSQAILADMEKRGIEVITPY